MALLGASQFSHIRQVLAAMERDGVTHPDLHVAALVHDLGKVLLLTNETPENVIGFTDVAQEAGTAIEFIDDDMLRRSLVVPAVIE